MCQHFGTRPEELHAAIGPGIGVCCFQVGPEVAAEFGQSGRVYVNLEETVRRQLLHAGVPAVQIHSANLCTMCRPEEFWSYRRDRHEAGRMHSFVGVR
jgi:copper oxidase (laccase) domain-containing protein